MMDCVGRGACCNGDPEDDVAGRCPPANRRSPAAAIDRLPSAYRHTMAITDRAIGGLFLAISIATSVYYTVWTLVLVRCRYAGRLTMDGAE